METLRHGPRPVNTGVSDPYADDDSEGLLEYESRGDAPEVRHPEAPMSEEEEIDFEIYAYMAEVQRALAALHEVVQLLVHHVEQLRARDSEVVAELEDALDRAGKAIDDVGSE